VAAVEAVAVFAVVGSSLPDPVRRHVAAIGGDERAAVGAGINVAATTLGTFVLVGLCAAMSGLMSGAELQNVDSTIGRMRS